MITARVAGPLVAVALLVTPPVGAQEGAARRPQPGPVPRTAGGTPDLQGSWSARGIAATQILEDHPAEPPFLREGKTIVVDPADGKIPYQPWALAERNWRRQPQNNYYDPDTHCLPAGIPRQMFDMNLPALILQTPGQIMMLHENNHAFRVIPTDGRPHLPQTLRPMQGDSVGRWEGGTLVVETTNNSGKNWLGQYGDFVSAAATVTERFTMADADTIDYRATIDDPAVFTRPWTIGFQLARNPDTEMLEAACHEDNQDPKYMKSLATSPASRGLR